MPNAVPLLRLKLAIILPRHSPLCPSIRHLVRVSGLAGSIKPWVPSQLARALLARDSPLIPSQAVPVPPCPVCQPPIHPH